MIEHWSSNEAANFIKNKEIYISYDKCYKYTVNNSLVTLSIIGDYKCNHEEADTKFAFFLNKIEGPENVLVRCGDTDILVILLGNMSHFDESINIWLLFGTGNNIRYINVNAIFAELEADVYTALPALTGCGFNPAFFRKAKNKPFGLLLKNNDYQKAFSTLYDTDEYESASKT